MMKRIYLLMAFVAFVVCAKAADKTYRISSPDGKVSVKVCVGKIMTYSIEMDGSTVLAPSTIAMTLTNGTVWGRAAKVSKISTKKINSVVSSPLYRQDSMKDECNEMTLKCKGYNVVFRAYDNGVAYRFISTTKGNYQVKDETVDYQFCGNQTVTTPYILIYEKDKTTFQEQFNNSFENTYTTEPLSEMDAKHLSFLPLTVDLGQGKKMCITETQIESYPGLYLYKGDGNALKGINAPRPKKWHQGGHNMLQLCVDEVENCIAKVSGPRSFPWRIAMLSREDKELAENNLSYLLAAPSRVADTSWIKPGKVAWDWWNDWNLSQVNFKAGINNDTYKYYIDFAAKHNIEYVILDEGWAVNLKADLLQVIPEIDLQFLVDYAKSKGVGIILWAGYYAFDRDMENVVKHFADMGVKGFKIDFMDRDDQIVTDFYYKAAEVCAKYHMVCDFHGGYKPAGMNRTYPNALNFEGVSGLEQMKWCANDRDQMTYDSQLPFIRQAAGPMDYTQGAMLNATKGCFRSIYSEPMSQGTRCHQLALYITLESPLNMMCDSPTHYMAETECTNAIAAIPTVWDETHVLCGEIGKYIVTARRSGNVWYVGGTTNWDDRDVKFTLPEGVNIGSKAELFLDGENANHKASDYKHTTINLQKEMTIHMASGGGFLMRVVD